LGGFLFGHLRDGLIVGGPEYAALCDDRCDISGGSDVEGGIFDGDAVRGHLLSVGVGNLTGVALFDRDEVAVRSVDVDGRPGGGDVKRDAMFFREDGDAIGPDLIGGVAVCRDAIGTDDDGLNATLRHEVGGHVVAENCSWDVVLHEFPGGEAGALEEGTGLIGEDVDLVTALDGGANDAESGAVAAGSECSGVAVGQDGTFTGEQGSAVRSHLFAGGDVFVVHATCLCDDRGFDLGDRGVFGGECVVEVADLVDAPEEIDGSGPGLREGFGDDRDLFGEGGDGGCGAAVDADGDAHGSGYTYGWSAADDHVADDGGDLLVVGGEDVGFFERKLGLVEEVYAFREPFEGRDHVPSSLDEFAGRRPLAGRRSDGCSRRSEPG